MYNFLDFSVKSKEMSPDFWQKRGFRVCVYVCVTHFEFIG